MKRAAFPPRDFLSGRKRGERNKAK